MYCVSSQGPYSYLRTLAELVLLDIPKEEITKYIEARSKDLHEEDDWAINFVAHLIIPKIEYKESKLLISAFKQIYKDIYDGKKNIEDLKVFLRKNWYKRVSIESWYGSHKKEDSSYSGYWALEAVLFVKLLGIDDSILKDEKYYPYNLIHWQDK